MKAIKEIPERTVIYRSSYGLTLGRWDRLMNELWYYTVEKEKLWAKIVFYPLDYLESLYHRLTWRGDV